MKWAATQPTPSGRLVVVAYGHGGRRRCSPTLPLRRPDATVRQGGVVGPRWPVGSAAWAHHTGVVGSPGSAARYDSTVRHDSPWTRMPAVAPRRSCWPVGGVSGSGWLVGQYRTDERKPHASAARPGGGPVRRDDKPPLPRRGPLPRPPASFGTQETAVQAGAGWYGHQEPRNRSCKTAPLVNLAPDATG